MKSTKTLFLIFIGSFLLYNHSYSQKDNTNNLVYDPELNQMVVKNTFSTGRTLRYKPDGEDFVITNGNKKFNRALYGTHTGFRVETGDVPEFALYLPRMGGNLSFQIKDKKTEKNLNDVSRIVCRYRAGSRIYDITDPVLKKGSIRISALAMSEAEGLILKIETKNIPGNIELSWIFGGCADKRFSREGDLGVDPPDCFDLKPAYCTGNEFEIQKNSFQVVFGAKKDKKLTGTFPEKSILSIDKSLPVLKGKLKISGTKTYYLSISVPQDKKYLPYSDLASLFQKSENDRKIIASQIKIDTPDPYINTLGSTLSVAADGIWSGETWLHGAVGWRMPLSGWRAAYTGDALGWHDRSRKHFDAYADSQVKDVPPVFPHPNQDSAMNLARAVERWGTQMYSNGYICRNPHENNKMHHYDMNLCYIDELLWHLNWTGDLDYAKKIWPTITSSLAWEKRNYDPDNDGLYDAYCCIWASDGLYYNGGAVTHSSAYNYRANKIAAEIAAKIGENPKPYSDEADKILKAINAQLWIPSKGHWAEYKDLMGKKSVHESAAVWTIYHAIDSDIQDEFQGYEATRYLDTEIPHIPVQGKGLEDDGYATISTSNWMPYCWSINNVAFAEVMNTALAYWEAGRNEAGFKLLKSSVLDGMYLGSSPGNIGQISYYDAARGECYRDFGDPIGVMSRALVQGLFGIIPDALNNKLVLKPGFPQSWDHASIKTPDIDFSFKHSGNSDIYTINQHFEKELDIELQIPCRYSGIEAVTINGKSAAWQLSEKSIQNPVISIFVPYLKGESVVSIIFSEKKLNLIVPEFSTGQNNGIEYTTKDSILNLFDPQGILKNPAMDNHKLKATISGEAGYHTFFVKLQSGKMKWWAPVNVTIQPLAKQEYIAFSKVNPTLCETVNIDSHYNESVNNIFENKYLSPRPPYTSLEIPTQGIGEWCHPKETAKIDDSGMRSKIENNILSTSLGVPFRTPATGRNIIFTSLWDNYPEETTLPLTGNASSAYLLMAGTTNHMQTHFVNGTIYVNYTDGTRDSLNLINPENWCPIEQDYFDNNQAFRLNAPRPYRLHFKTGLVSNNLEKELKIEGVYGRHIEDGAGILLDMPLNKTKTLKSIKVSTKANDVIIGLMAVTLQR